MNKRYIKIGAAVLAAVVIYGIILAIRGNELDQGNVTVTPPPAQKTVNPAAQAATQKVTYQDGSFQPQSVAVKVGQSVAFTNESGSPIEIVSDNGDIESGSLETKDTFLFVITSPGTTSYHIKDKPAESGTVVAQ